MVYFRATADGSALRRPGKPSGTQKTRCTPQDDHHWLDGQKSAEAYEYKGQIFRGKSGDKHKGRRDHRENGAGARPSRPAAAGRRERKGQVAGNDAGG